MRKNIIITGGSEGIGFAIAKELASDHNVIILSRSEEKLQRAAKELGCEYAVCDVADYQKIDEVFEAIIRKYKKIDVLINNAGIWMQGNIEDSDPEQISRLIDINTKGTIFCTKKVVPFMKTFGEGLIINMISQDGIVTKSARSVYCASKWALTGFTKCMQSELSGSGVRISGIYPGLVRTNLYRNAGVDRNLPEALNPEDIAKTVKFLVDSRNEIFISEIGVRDKDN